MASIPRLIKINLLVTRLVTESLLRRVQESSLSSLLPSLRSVKSLLVPYLSSYLSSLLLLLVQSFGNKREKKG